MIFYNATKRLIMLLQNQPEFVTPPRKNPPLSIQQQERVSVSESTQTEANGSVPVFSSVEKAQDYLSRR